MSSLTAPSAIPVPTYHDELRRYLQTTEPELWAWFAETLTPDAAEVDDAEVELLKSAYRLDGDVHGILVADAALLAGRLDLGNDITLYQELDDTGRNARVQIFGDAVHIVFSGDLLGLLNPGEQQAVLAHELAHVSLLLRDDGVYRVLDSMVHRMADDPAAHDVIEETARRLRLHTEIYADAVAAHLTGERDHLISSVVKTQSGLRNVDPVAYLRQAEEILNADDRISAAWSHPELHIRVACLAANVAGGIEGANPALIRSMVEGPDDLDRADLLSQLRIQKLSERVLLSGRGAAVHSSAAPTAEIDAHIKGFVGLNLDDGPRDVGDGIPAVLDDDELAEAEPSIRYLAAALLVDLALVGDHASPSKPANPDLASTQATPTQASSEEATTAASAPEPPSAVSPPAPASGDDELAVLRRLGSEADRIGVAKEFDRIVSRATERSLAEVRKLRRNER